MSFYNDMHTHAQIKAALEQLKADGVISDFVKSDRDLGAWGIEVDGEFYMLALKEVASFIFGASARAKITI